MKTNLIGTQLFQDNHKAWEIENLNKCQIFVKNNKFYGRIYVKSTTGGRPFYYQVQLNCIYQ